MSILSDYLPQGIIAIGQSVITKATTFNFATNVNAVIVLVGAGGSGAVAKKGTAAIKAHAQGGNAGGTVMQRIRFQAGINYTFVIGTGGNAVGVTSNSAQYSSNGVAGGDTYLSSTALASNIVAKGGYGGVKMLQAASTAFAGDTAFQSQTWGTDADLILPGGYGGAAECTVTQSANYKRGIATGGGAPNLSGLTSERLAGGSAQLTTTTAGSSGFGIATGGGGVSGRGGELYNTGTQISPAAASGSGGSGGSGQDFLTITSTADLASTGAVRTPFEPATLFGFTGAGADGENTDAAAGNDGDPLGGGGGGKIVPKASTVTTAINGGHGGYFGGGGGCASPQYSSANALCYGGDGGYGAGGGGAVSATGTSTAPVACMSGAGGDGIAFIFILSSFGTVLA